MLISFRLSENRVLGGGGGGVRWCGALKDDDHVLTVARDIVKSILVTFWLLLLGYFYY